MTEFFVLEGVKTISNPQMGPNERINLRGRRENSARRAGKPKEQKAQQPADRYTGGTPLDSRMERDKGGRKLTVN